MATRKKPNVLFVYTDEQRFDTLQAYGNERIQMPSVNRLAEDSHVFRHTYVTQAVCTPSRSSLLTGLWPHQTGVVNNNIPLPESTACVPELLVNGLDDPPPVSAHIGKWHLGDEIYRQHGFDEWHGTEDTYYAFYGANRNARDDRSSYDQWLRERGVEPVNWVSGVPGIGEHVEFVDRFTREQISALPEHLGRPAFLAEKAQAFIKTHSEEQFVLYVNFLEPHMPFHGPRDNQYDPDSVTLPPDFRLPPPESLSRRETEKAQRYWEHGFEDHRLQTEQERRQLLARYWGLCSQVDSAVEHIIRTLHDLALYDDTIIVFTSDHGDMMGGHGLIAKSVQYEGSVRVPLLIKEVGQSSQYVHDAPVSHIDIVPTLLDLMQMPTPDGLPGRSLRSSGNPSQPGLAPRGDAVFVEWNPPPQSTSRGASGESIRTVVTPEGWKFNWSSVGDHQLFNLKTDPGEFDNLYRSRTEITKECMDRIMQWQLETEDPTDLPAIG